ncbi:MAG: UrcA family protein [Pseudomonadota bacterium]
MTKFITPTAAFIVASAALASPAFAASDFEFTFEFDRAAAETRDGAERIHASLEAEVTDHCRTEGFPTRLLNAIGTQRCIDDTMDDAVAKIGTEAMDTVHAASRN